MTIQKRKGHRHFYDVVDRFVIDSMKSWQGKRVMSRRVIRIRQCACGEMGYEVPF